MPSSETRCRAARSRIFVSSPRRIGIRDAFLDELRGGADDLRLVALGEDDALRIADGAVDEPAHEPARATEPRLESIAIALEVDELRRHAARDGRPRHRRRDGEQNARIEGEGDEVVRPEVDVAQPVQRGDGIGDVLLRERGERARRRHLHLLVDLGGAHVERAAEDEREAEDVVDLIRVVAAPRGDDRVVADGAHLVGGDLRIRIGEGEDDRPVGHLRDHLARDRAGDGEADEDVGADERVGDGARRRLANEARLVRVHVAVAAVVDHAGAVAHEDVLALHAEPHVVLGRADRRGAGAGEDDLHLVDLLADDLERVEERGAGDDRRAVLVVVEDGDLERLPQRLLDVEAVGRLDVLEVDPADGGLEELAELDDVVGRLGADLEVEDVDVGELLEEVALALHDRLAGERADVAESEDGGAVGDDGDEVAACRVACRRRRDRP